MKLKSLILGSVAAAGLSTAGFAADLGVLTSLDVCNTLGLSGLTISSDTNCLQISGGVNYEFAWGDYRGPGASGPLQIITRVPFGETPDFIRAGSNGPDRNLDWQSKVEAWITAVATSSTDFGPAKATITLKYNDVPRFRNEAFFDNDGETFPGTTTAKTAYFDEAYVAIGDTTIIAAGKRKFGAAGSIANLSDDEPFNVLGSFISGGVDGGGVLIDGDDKRLGGNVIQVISDLGNGVSAGIALENIDNAKTAGGQVVGAAAPYAGTLVGVLKYAGEGITAHVTALAGGVLDGQVETWAVHAGVTGTFDAFKIRAAAAYQRTAAIGILPDRDQFHGLVTGSATFDIFTIALTGEYARDALNGGLRDEGFGIGGSIGAKVTEGVAINLAARYFSGDNDLTATEGGWNHEEQAVQVAAQLIADISETIQVTGEIGAFYNNNRGTFFGDNNLTNGTYYGGLGLAWNPGGGFTSSVKGEITSQGAYRATFKASKSFE